MKGFSLLELLVVISLTLLLSGGLVAGYNRYTQTQKLKQAALTLRTDLRLAQDNAASGVKPSGCSTLIGYQITFSVGSYQSQADCVEGLVPPVNKINLPVEITFSAPLPTSFTFLVLTRGIDSGSTLDLNLTNHTNIYQLQVTPQGEIMDLGLQ